jgi:hypothetical protein
MNIKPISSLVDVTLNSYVVFGWIRLAELALVGC